jgi:hypothetical protein
MASQDPIIRASVKPSTHRWLLGGSAERCGARTVLAPTQHNRSSRRHRRAPRWAARPKSALVVSKTHKED